MIKRNLFIPVATAIIMTMVFSSCEKAEVSTAVTSVTMNETNLTLTVGATARLYASVQPQQAVNKNISFSSNAPDIASVDSDGLVNAINAGTATITATSEEGNKTATCLVTVRHAPANGVTLNADLLTLFVGETGTLTATVQPQSALNSVTWSSSNESVVLVDASGKITAKDLGMSTITATAATDNNHKATCTVIVAPQQKQMRMVTAIRGEVKIQLSGSGTVKIEWGDGANNSYTINNGTQLNHTYTSSSKRMITIFGENIIELACKGMNLTELDVSKNPVLAHLDLSDYWGGQEMLKNQLKYLDISKNTALTYLNCLSNEIISLNVNENTALKTLNCSYNLLTSLDVSRNKALESLDCGNNQLRTLDVSNNLALTSLNCFLNQLSMLDVSKNKALTSLNCGMNQLSSLNIKENTKLMSLGCISNSLTNLDISANKALDFLECSINPLSMLDVSNNTALTSLTFTNTQITSLDVSKNVLLNYLNITSNRLTSLDVSKNTALTTLYCSANQFTSLDVKNNRNLKGLYCHTNQLTNIDVSGLNALTVVSCGSNKMDAIALNAFFGTLNSTTVSGDKVIYISRNPGENDCDRSIATKKGWSVQN